MTRSRASELLEKLSRLVPGVSGYQDRETLRSSDRAVRGRAAASIAACRDRLSSLNEALSRRGRAALARIGDIDRVALSLEGIEDELRHAAYGYAGWFDAKGVALGDLERLYRHDLALLEAASALSSLVPDEDAAPGAADWLPALQKAAEDLKRNLVLRKTVLEGG